MRGKDDLICLYTSSGCKDTFLLDLLYRAVFIDRQFFRQCLQKFQRMKLCLSPELYTSRTGDRYLQFPHQRGRGAKL